MENNGNRLPIIEALILSSPEPLSPKKILDILQNASAGEVDAAITDLNNKYLSTNSSFRIRKLAGGYQIYVTENYSGYVEELFTRRRTQGLTRAALETMAIIAYRQPVTRVDIEMIRGVSSDSAIRTLLERKFITLSGRARTIGRPLLYGTTDEFLKYFGLDSLNDLPRMEEIEELLSEKEPDFQQTLSFDTVRPNTEDNSLPDQDDNNGRPGSDKTGLTVDAADNPATVPNNDDFGDSVESLWPDTESSDQSLKKTGGNG